MPDLGWKRHVFPSLQTEAVAKIPIGHPPRLGEDNAYVYRELLGFSAEQYAAWEAAGHIGADYAAQVQ